MQFHKLLILACPIFAVGCQEPAETCEEGSVERDGQCYPAVAQLRLSHLDVRYDLSQPVFVNNRVPITFGIVADSVDPQDPVTRNVAVSFSFVEANPSDPENPLSCGSSAIDVEVVADGTEQLVDAFIWPTTLCGALAANDVEFNLQVDFDGGDELAAELESDLDAPSVLFSAAKRDDAINQRCRASLDGDDPGLGCVHAIKLRPTPADADGVLIDVRYALSASSSVAVVPFQPTEDIGPDGPADVDPSLVVQAQFVVNGRDPYISTVDSGLIPASLVEQVPSIADDLRFGLDAEGLAALTVLPGHAVVSYTLSPASDAATELPLTITDPADPSQKVIEAVVDELLPGTANDVAHELHIEGATLEAVSPGGVWADESDFVIRGCFAAEFPQDGNQGEGQIDDCRELEVVLVREAPPASGAASISFDKAFERNLGSSRIAINSSMSTQNRLDLNGASSHTEAEVLLKGKLGKSFEVTLARAFSHANLDRDPTLTAYDVGVEAFGQSIYSVSKQEPTIVQSDDFSVAKSFTIAKLGFGFGPITIGFKVGVGGTLGFETEDTLEVLTNNASCQELLNAPTDTITLCGRLTRVATPNFGLTGSVEGGIDLKLVKAAVGADLRFVTTRFPLDTTLGWGLTADEQLLVRGDVTWDMTFQPLSGDVFIIGKVGFKKFAKTLKVNLFSFASPSLETRLMSASMGNFEVLQ